MLGDAGMDLLKPWPLKLTFDVVLRQKTLEGHTLHLLIGVAALVVFTHLFEGLFNYLAAFFLNRAGRPIIFDIRPTLGMWSKRPGQISNILVLPARVRENARR